jgi:uncharacterized Fe-S radical SAM superfamily protein PflX
VVETIRIDTAQSQRPRLLAEKLFLGCLQVILNFMRFNEAAVTLFAVCKQYYIDSRQLSFPEVSVSVENSHFDGILSLSYQRHITLLRTSDP